jgi:lipopolysaccharide heptosyltransferase I
MSSRILIVRLSALGDVIHGLPVLCALRDALPQAHLAWVVEGRAGDLLEGHAALDELIRVPRGWLKSPREVRQLRRTLREQRFDTAVDLQSLTKSAVAAWLSGARRRIGKAGRDGRELSKWLHNELVVPEGHHVIDHYLGLLRPLGIRSPRVHFDVPRRADDEATIDRFLQTKQLSHDGFLLVNPGAGWPSKLWPTERYGEVTRYVAKSHGLPSVVVWAGDEERRLAEAIVRHSHGSATLAPPTTITELAALSRHARLFLGSDTGPMHLAVAVDTPAISLHGPSRAEWCGAYGPQNIRLQVRLDEPRTRHRHNTDDSAMRAINTELVCQACDQMLARKSRRCG